MKEFQKLLAENIDKLGTLGDFTANYVLSINNVLRNYWKDASMDEDEAPFWCSDGPSRYKAISHTE